MFPSVAEIKNFGSAGGIVGEIGDISVVIVAILSGSLGQAFFPTGVKGVRHCARDALGNWKTGRMFQDSSDDICEFLCC